MSSTLLTPRPEPDRRVPARAGASLVALAFPLFLAAGWPLAGWALGAGLWVGSQLLGLAFARAGIGEPTLRGSGLVAFGMMARGVLIPIAAIAVALADPVLALAGALVYALAYTLELAWTLVLYFFGGARR